MGKEFALHSTTRRNAVGIEKKGLKKQPFWKSTNALWRLKTLSLFSSPKAYVLADLSHSQMKRAVFDSLQRANLHLNKNFESKFDIRNIRVFLIDTKKSKMTKSKTHQLNLPNEKGQFQPLEERVVFAPSKALRKIEFSESEVEVIEKAIAKLEPGLANVFITNQVLKKIDEVMK